MAQARVTMMCVVLMLCLPVTARSETCACCSCKALDLVPSPQEVANARAERELVAVLASGVAVTAASYILGVLVARTEPNPVAAVDTIPVVGPIAAASRSPQDADKASLLAFFGGAQAMGLLVIAAAATDLAQRHNLVIDASAGPNGCGASVTWRLP